MTRNNIVHGIAVVTGFIEIFIFGGLIFAWGTLVYLIKVCHDRSPRSSNLPTNSMYH